MGYHLLNKPSYNLDVQDVPPPRLEAKVNVREANELFKQAMEYKGKGLGNDYVLNQRRAELLFREMLEKYPNSDKIADVAYQLGELYEGRAYKQYDRAAALLRAVVPVAARAPGRTPGCGPRCSTTSHLNERRQGDRTVPPGDRARHRPRPHQNGREAARRS